ncbi:MAG: hypothetical protein WCZ27_03190 [Tissierellaceae bacterium]
MIYVTSLNIKEEKGGRVKAISQGHFQKGRGLVGDVNSQGGEREVSIFGLEGKEEIGDNREGICMRRFYGNIEIRGLDFASLEVGQTLRIGNTVHEITVIGKDCFPDCILVKRGQPCPLTRTVIFTRLIEGGDIEIGDQVTRLDKTDEKDK